MVTRVKSERASYTLQVTFSLVGVIFILFAVIFGLQESQTKTISAIISVLLTLGTTFLASSIFALLYQKFKGPNLTKEEGAYIGILALYKNRRSITPDDWTEFIKDAKHVIWLYGISEGGFSADERIPPILCRMAKAKREVKILLLEPNAELARKIDIEEGGNGAGLPGSIHRSLNKFFEIKNSNSETREYISVKTYKEYPQISIVRSDDKMLITPYLRYYPGDTCPTFLIHDTSKGIFQYYKGHFERMWEEAQTKSYSLENKKNGEEI